MIKASLVLLIGLGAISSTSAHAQMQQGYANGQPDVTVDRSVLQDLKGYQPPPMFGGDLMPPATNRVDTTRQVVEEPPRKSVEVTPPTNPVPAAVRPPTTAAMTAPNAEDLLNHPTQNFHVLTERNASLTAPSEPSEPLDNANGPLLPLPDDDDADPAKVHAKAIKAKTVKEETKKETKKADIKKDDKKKESAKKEVAKKEKPAEKKAETAKPEKVKIEATKIVPPNPNAYRPKTAQSMPAVPPIKVEKNVLPPMAGMSNSPLPVLPPTTDPNVQPEKPTPGLRMMDAALERQMESDETKIKEQLADTDVKTVKAPADKKSSKSSSKTLVFAASQTNVPDKMKAQIKSQILPELTKDTKSRIQIISFATSPDKTESAARRLSLSRALAVRDVLKDMQIDTSRIDVRALPTEGNASPADKVNIVLLK